MKRITILGALLVANLTAFAQTYNSGTMTVFSNANMTMFGSFTNDTTGTVKMLSSSNLYIQKDLTNNGTFTSNLGTLHATGSSLQNFNGSSLIHTNNFNVNNSAGIKVDNEVQVDSALTFTNGVINTDRADIATEFIHFLAGSSYTGQTDAKHIDGVVRKTGNTAFVFPVGDSADLQPIAISAPSSATDHFTAYYREQSPHALYSRASKDGNINHVSNCEYWILNRTNGSSNVEVSLNWDANSCGVTNLCELLVARWNGSQWVSEGNGGTTGAAAGGTVVSGNAHGSCGTASAVTSFSPFTLASNTTNNPLPIELVHFEATLVENSKVQLEWETSMEINNDYFTIERSQDARSWEEIQRVEGAGNSSQHLYYTVFDENPYSGVSYYRLKQTDFNKEFSHSSIETININSSSVSMNAYPNPASQQLTVVGDQSEIKKLRMYDALGRRVDADIAVIEENAEKKVLDVSGLANGIYIIKTEKQAIKVTKQ